MTDRFDADRATLRAELQRLARARRTATYGEAARLVGRAPRGLGRLLDAIGREEAACGRPDLGALVVAVRTGLPSYVGPGEADRERAVAVQEAVFRVWAGADLILARPDPGDLSDVYS